MYNFLSLLELLKRIFFSFKYLSLIFKTKINYNGEISCINEKDMKFLNILLNYHSYFVKFEYIFQ
jgi:hypothetical protein